MAIIIQWRNVPCSKILPYVYVQLLVGPVRPSGLTEELTGLLSFLQISERQLQDPLEEKDPYNPKSITQAFWS